MCTRCSSTTHNEPLPSRSLSGRHSPSDHPHRSRNAEYPLGEDVSSMSIYDKFDVRPIINGAGPATRLGGTIMDDEVLEAMAQAARAYVKIDELQEAAGRVIAEITGAESGYVTSGAA